MRSRRGSYSRGSYKRKSSASRSVSTKRRAIDLGMRRRRRYVPSSIFHTVPLLATPVRFHKNSVSLSRFTISKATASAPKLIGRLMDGVLGNETSYYDSFLGRVSGFPESLSATYDAARRYVVKALSSTDLKQTATAVLGASNAGVIAKHPIINLGAVLTNADEPYSGNLLADSARVATEMAAINYFGSAFDSWVRSAQLSSLSAPAIAGAFLSSVAMGVVTRFGSSIPVSRPVIQRDGTVLGQRPYDPYESFDRIDPKLSRIYSDILDKEQGIDLSNLYTPKEDL